MLTDAGILDGQRRCSRRRRGTSSVAGVVAARTFVARSWRVCRGRPPGRRIWSCALRARRRHAAADRGGRTSETWGSSSGGVTWTAYAKGWESIEAILAAAGATDAVLALEERRRRRRGSRRANRLANADHANVVRMTRAAQEQLAAAKRLRADGALDDLPDRLREAALLRIRYPGCRCELAARGSAGDEGGHAPPVASHRRARRLSAARGREPRPARGRVVGRGRGSEDDPLPHVRAPARAADGVWIHHPERGPTTHEYDARRSCGRSVQAPRRSSADEIVMRLRAVTVGRRGELRAHGGTGGDQRVRTDRAQLLPRTTEARRDVEIVAVNDLGDAETMAHLLRYDSNLGPFDGTVEARRWCDPRG